ncbi:MAG: hypothetical protein WCP32_15610, partial [Bacteroidota bacterium]
ITASAAGCNGPATATHTVSVNPLLPASVSIAANPTGAICAGTSVTFTATPTNGGTPTYQWKNGATTITGATNSTYTSAALTNGAVITVVMTSNTTCATGSPATSNAVTMVVNPLLPASVSIAASANPVCLNTNITFTATPVNGGTSPVYQWKLNGVNAGTNSTTYSNASLSDGDIITCTLTSSAVCVTGSPATSNAVTMSIGSPAVSTNSTETCLRGSTGTITATGNSGHSPYTFSLNSGAYQSSGIFTGLAAGTYLITVKDNIGCTGTTNAIVTSPAPSGDDQTTAGSDTWIGHVYDGTNFNSYFGHYTEPETFDENFGGNYNCFTVTSNSTFRSIYTEQFSVRYRMNSTRKGLFIANLGSDDGSRLYVDGTLIYNNWVDQAFTTKPRVLMSLTGASALVYEYYENLIDNRVIFQSIVLVLSNTLNANLTQTICAGVSGLAISGDVYGTLPTGITLSGTGYQWTYSTAPLGSRTIISGATGATYTPSTYAAPFNVPGTYYIFRDAILSSANNISPNPYVASNESNAAIITVVAAPSATISYTGNPYCKTIETAQPVTRTGATGGSYSASPAGLIIDASSGAITPGTSTAGTYTVSYTIAPSGGCGIVTTTTSVTITALPVATFSYTGSPYCLNATDPTPAYSGGGVAGTFSSTSGLVFVSAATGQVNLASSTAGTYTVTNTIAASAGCSQVIATSSITINPNVPVSISIVPSVNSVCDGTSVTFTATPTNGGTSPVYQWKVNGINVGTSTATYNYVPANNDAVTCVLASNATSCTTNNPATSNSVTMTVNPNLPVSVSTAANPTGAICSGTNVTLTASALPTTLSPVLISEGFNNSTNNWTTINNSIGGLPLEAAWTLRPDGYVSTYSGAIHSNDATQFYFSNSDAQGTGTTTSTILQSPVMNTVNYTSLSLNFYHYFRLYLPGETGKVQVSTNGTSWTDVSVYTSNQGGPIAFANAIINLDTYIGNPIFYVRFKYDADWGYNWAIDNVTISGTPSQISYNYSWTASPSGTAGLSAGAGTPSPANAAITVNPTASTTYTATASSGNGCDKLNAIGVTVTTVPTATISYAGTPFCKSVSSAQSVTITGTGSYTGGAYSSTAGLTINSASGAITPSTSTAGTYTVTYTIPAFGGCGTVPVTTSVTITASPVATFSYTGSPYCSNVANPSPTFSGGGAAGTFSSTAGLNFVSAASGQVNLATSAAGTYTITNTIAASNGCGIVTATAPITITTLPVASIVYSGNPFCKSVATAQSVTQTGATGGTYSASPTGLSINSSTGAITPSTSTAGTYTVTYTIAASGGCGVVTATTSVTITAVPTATISYAGTPFCSSLSSAQSVTISGTGAYIGGAYSSAAGLSINSGTGAITPSTSAPGTYTVTYTIPASGGCLTVAVTTSVTITALPVATFSYTSTPYCSNAANPFPTFSGGGVAGTFSSTTGLNFVSAASGQVNLTTSAAGTYTVTNTIAASNGCGIVTATTAITITTLPVASILYAGNPFCKSVATAQSVTQTGTTGGTYTASPAGLSINSSTGAITPSTSTAGTYTVTYTIAASGGCGVVTATTPVTITAVPTATISYAGTPFCSSLSSAQSVTISGTGLYTGGAYSSTAGLTINSVTGAITPSTSAAGTYTVTYTIPASGGCLTVAVTTLVTITALPVATFSYTGSPYCNNTTDPMPTFSGGGVAGIFSSTAGLIFLSTSTGQVDLSASTIGTYTVTNTIAASGGCGQVSASGSITITGSPVATIAYPGSPFCQSLSNPQPVTLTGTTGGVFSASPVGLNINASTGAIIPGSSAPGAFTVTYSIAASGGCNSVTTTTNVTITALPVATFSYTGSPYCSNAANPFPTFSGGGIAGTFSSTPGLIFVSAFTGQINLAGSTTGSYTVTNTIAAGGGCSSVSSTSQVTINPIAPSTPGAISGNSIQCPNLPDQIYSISAVPSATTYTWSVPAGWTITSGDGTTTITVTTGTAGQNGIISVTAGNACGTSAASSMTVSIYQVEVVATLGSVNACYSTVKDAFDKINDGTHQGEITIKIHGNTTETASAALYQSGYISPTDTSNYISIIVYPTVTGITVTGNLSAPLIDLNGADSVTIDGRVNATGSATDMIISNSSASNTEGTSTI